MPKKVSGLSSSFIKQYNKEIKQEEKRMKSQKTKKKSPKSRKTKKKSPKKEGGKDYADDAEGTGELNGLIREGLKKTVKKRSG